MHTRLNITSNKKYSRNIWSQNINYGFKIYLIFFTKIPAFVIFDNLYHKINFDQILNIFCFLLFIWWLSNKFKKKPKHLIINPLPYTKHIMFLKFRKISINYSIKATFIHYNHLIYKTVKTINSIYLALKSRNFIFLTE